MNVLVFGAHPDDLEIGMGGTIAKHVEAGDEVVMVVGTVPSQAARRKEEARKGAKVLGGNLRFLEVESDEFEYNRRLVGQIDRLLKEIDPELIYTHWDQDSHQDHNNLSRGVMSATRKNRCSVLMYEQTIPGGIVPGGFKAQSFVDVSAHIDRKIESIQAHESQHEINGDLWLQGVRGRASYRGFQINVAYAEAFEIIKEIETNFRYRS
ncbi:MAG: PIG-L family deacetylase [Candidatus Binatia bacterium]|nr:PIG-L family deacetylase [Candidatus Binatia bacterium]